MIVIVHPVDRRVLGKGHQRELKDHRTGRHRGLEAPEEVFVVGVVERDLGIVRNSSPTRLVGHTPEEQRGYGDFLSHDDHILVSVQVYAFEDTDAADAVYKKLDAAQNRIVWLDPAPANNTWVIAIRGDLPAFPGRKCLDSLAAYLAEGGRFKLAASAEFVESPAALPAFEKTYGFQLKAEQLLTLSGGNTAATLRAAAEGISGVNAGMAYGTDGELAALGLTALCDDKGAQIVYAPAPVIRQAVLDEHPDIAAALVPVFASLSLETLQALNARIAVAGEDAGAVAVDYLKSKHFLP